jgi:dienelactone hydrolase
MNANNSIPEALVVCGEAVRPQRVEFESQNPFLPEDVSPEPETPTPVHGALFLPERVEGPLPAVVILQGLGGVKPERELTYGHKLARAGFAALAVDSFGARGLAASPDFWKALRVSTWALLADAFAALRFLAGHPAVNPDAVGFIGFSWGGMASVLAAYEQVRTTFLGDSDLRFGGHVSYYGCSIPRLADPTTTGAPVLVMAGRRDANVSVPRTRQICDDLRRGGSDVDLRIFDAFHQWDGKDEELRHVDFSLAGLKMTLTRDNRMVVEPTKETITSRLSNVWQLIRNVGLGGYDIRRDAALHRQTDRLLLDFLHGMAAQGGAALPRADRVPLGVIGSAADG